MVSERLFNEACLLVILSLVSASYALPKPSSAKQPGRYPPPDTCDVCDIFQNGLDSTTKLLESIKEKAQKAPECVAKVTVLAGPLSGPADDDPSSVECPVDTTLVNCRCSTESNDCEGASSTGRKCTVFKGTSTTATQIQALATCVPRCTGTFFIAQAPLAGIGMGRPVATCPANSEIVNCWIYSTNSVSGYLFPNISADSRSCEPVVDCPAIGCTVKALCQAV